MSRPQLTLFVLVLSYPRTGRSKVEEWFSAGSASYRFIYRLIADVCGGGGGVTHDHAGGGKIFCVCRAVSYRERLIVSHNLPAIHTLVPRTISLSCPETFSAKIETQIYTRVQNATFHAVGVGSISVPAQIRRYQRYFFGVCTFLRT